MIAVGLANFTAEVMNSPEPVLVDINASWCQPCKMQHRILEQVEQQFGRRIVTLNADDEPDLTAHFKVSALPTLIMFKGGKEINRVVGMQQAPAIEAMFVAA